LDVDIGTLDLMNRRAEIKSIKVDSPKVDLIRRKNGQLNFSGLTRESPKEEDAEPGQAPFGFNVGEMALSGGTVRLVDEGPEKPFRGNLEAVALNVKGLGNAQGTKADVRFACDTLRKSTLAIEGTLQLTPLQAQGKFDLAGLQLGAFTP